MKRIFLAVAAFPILIVPAIAQQSTGDPRPKERRICERVEELGSRLNRRRVCRTIRELEAEATETQRRLMDLQGSARGGPAEAIGTPAPGLGPN